MPKNQQIAKGQRQRREQQIGSVPTPARACALGHIAHGRVGYSIPQRPHGINDASHGIGQAQHIGIEIKQIQADALPIEIKGKVTTAIADFLRPAEARVTNFACVHGLANSLHDPPRWP